MKMVGFPREIDWNFYTIWNFKKTMEMTWLHIDEPSAENNGAAVTAPIIFMTKS